MSVRGVPFWVGGWGGGENERIFKVEKALGEVEFGCEINHVEMCVYIYGWGLSIGPPGDPNTNSHYITCFIYK